MFSVGQTEVSFIRQPINLFVNEKNQVQQARNKLFILFFFPQDSEVEDKKDYGQGSENEDGEPKQRKRKRYVINDDMQKYLIQPK